MAGGGPVFLPLGGEASLFLVTQVNISVWKTVWIMCKTLLRREVSGVPAGYAPKGGQSLFSEFYGFLSKAGKKGVKRRGDGGERWGEMGREGLPLPAGFGKLILLRTDFTQRRNLCQRRNQATATSPSAP